MNQKSVTVLLATYNSEKYVVEQIESIIEQTYKNITILVSDDGSTDNTNNIVDEFIKNDSRIKRIKSEKPLKSAQGNFMFLLSNAQDSDYYMFCDHDDVWCRDKIEKTLSKMIEIEEENLPTLVHSDLFVVDEELKVLSKSMFSSQKLSKEQPLKNALVQNNVTGCTVMINRALKELACKKTDVENLIMHDWFLAILACSMGNVGFVDEPLILYRQHGGNQVGAVDASNAEYIAKKAMDSKGNKNSLINTFAQGKMIAELYKNELGENYSTVEAYGEMLNQNKIQRLCTCIKYGFWKNTLIRKIGQIIYL